MRRMEMIISPSPHIYTWEQSPWKVWSVVACFVPALAWGIFVFGLRALLVVFLACVSSLGVEILANLMMKRSTLRDGTALLTGLLIGACMPSSVPLYIPVLAAVFAQAVVKWSFGGLGNNWMNPAIAGLTFALVSWTAPMTTWVMPSTLTGINGISGATPLGFLKTGISAMHSTWSPMGYLGTNGIIRSAMDAGISGWLNTTIFNPLGARLPEGYIDLILGNRPGSIGEVSIILLLAGSVFLIARRIIRWEVPFGFIVVFAVFNFIFGGLRFGTGFFSGDVLFSLCSGSVILCAFYCATDPVTSPMTKGWMLLYGAMLGLFSFVFRMVGAFPEGTAFALLLMNCFVPLMKGARSRGKTMPRGQNAR